MASNKAVKKLPKMYYTEPKDPEQIDLADMSSIDSADSFENSDYKADEGTKPSGLIKLRKRGAPPKK